MKLKLLGGLPISTEGFGAITPLTVREMVDYGYTKYMTCLNILSVDAKDFLGDVIEKVDKSEVPNILDLLLTLGGEDVEEIMESALTLFLRGEVVVDKENLQVIVNFGEEDVRVVNRDNFDDIREIVKYQNYVNQLDTNSESGFKPANEEARKLKERMDKLKAQREAIKRKSKGEDEGDDIDIYDIISALSSKSYGLSENSVYDLTIYQVYSKFKRLELIDQYDINIKSILAGAQDVKIKHWSSKLE